MTGRGIDRHLLGLRLLLRPLNGESSALFEDDLFERSSRWKLSTSGLSAGLLFKGTGFGTVYEDGYGINCMVSFRQYTDDSDYCLINGVFFPRYGCS